MYAASISQYRTLLFSYMNLAHRLQWATQAFSQTLFYYGLSPGVLYDPAYAYISRDQALSTQTARGGSVFGIYPFNRYARVELSGGLMQFKQQFNDANLQAYSEQYQQQVYGTQLLANGTFAPLGIAYVQETTVFRDYGPLSGNTMRLSYEYAPKIGGLLSRQTADLDARYYMRIGTNGVLALRARGFKSWGDVPDFTYFGGNSDMRGYDYLQFLGQRAFFGNAELRFPLIEAMATPVGVLGGIRGVFFFDIGAAGYNGQPFQVTSKSTEVLTPVTGYVPNFETGNYDPVYGDPITVSGFRLKDARASYGVGLETFALGFPIHFDWSWRTTFNKSWEDYLFAASGGSAAWRRAKFSVWIGYDF
jgi:outer membrane protein assembly factor BamA